MLNIFSSKNKLDEINVYFLFNELDETSIGCLFYNLDFERLKFRRFLEKTFFEVNGHLTKLVLVDRFNYV